MENHPAVGPRPVGCAPLEPQGPHRDLPKPLEPQKGGYLPSTHVPTIGIQENRLTVTIPIANARPQWLHIVGDILRQYSREALQGGLTSPPYTPGGGATSTQQSPATTPL